MALVNEAMKEKEYDVRLIRRSLSKGLITEQDVDKNEKKLADDSSNADFTNIETLAESISHKGYSR